MRWVELPGASCPDVEYHGREAPFPLRATIMLTRAVVTGLVFLGCLLGIAGWLAGSRAEEKAKSTALGAKVANSNSLRDVRGNRRALHDLKDNKAIVLVFIGAECPV